MKNDKKELSENLGISIERMDEISSKMWKWISDKKEGTSLDMMMYALQICETKAEVAYIVHGTTHYMVHETDPTHNLLKELLSAD